MIDPTVDLLRTLRNDSILELVSGVVVLSITGGSLLSKCKKNTSNKDSNIKNRNIIMMLSNNASPTSSLIPYSLGLAYGTTNVIKGTINLIKYSSLLSESKLPRFQISFYLTIPFENLTNGQTEINQVPLKTARFNISDLTDAVIKYLGSKDIKLLSIEIQDSDTESPDTESPDTISSNVKIDITFNIIKKSKTPTSIISSILSGTITINEYTLNISAEKSSTLNDDIE